MPENKDHRLHLNRRDLLLMAAVTLAFALFTFLNLGTTRAPQTEWVASKSGENVVFDLGQSVDFRMNYYGGICDSNFTVELSNDGEVWSAPEEALYRQGEIFRWIRYAPQSEPNVDLQRAYYNARYLRITARSAGLRLREFGFFDLDGNLLPVRIAAHSGYLEELEADEAQLFEAMPPADGASRSAAKEGAKMDPALLIDEQDTVHYTPSYFNGTYFDEIYHARTAYELLHGLNVYEWTHPPLGKATMSLGIAIFGMTPFGWRFMGALVGVLMLPLMYLLIKQLTKSTALSFVGMCLLALDSMHFTQTRIATIDSYAVFWIMLMYLFMIRYLQMDWRSVKLIRTLPTLLLCGVAMGVAIATKWIGAYAALGLAALLFWKLISEIMHAGELKRAFAKRCIWTLLCCLIFFVLIPALIYYFSYTPQLKSEGVNSVLDMLQKRRIEEVVELQKGIFDYHAGLGGDTHSFRSPWYQWPIIWWPMWYYSGAQFMPADMVSSISCMGNPAVWWVGLISLLLVLVLSAWKKRAPKNWLIVLIGFAAQFLPWVLVPRSTFIYHYFASVPFIILCTVLLLQEVRRRSETSFRALSACLLGVALMLFVAFYPLESGMPVARSYAKLLRWFKWYNF